MEILKGLNAGVAFLLELCLLAALAYSGYHLSKNTVIRWILALLLPAVIAVVWGMFMAPLAAHHLSTFYHFIASLVIFGIGAALLYKVGHQKQAMIFAVLVVVNQLLAVLWKQ